MKLQQPGAMYDRQAEVQRNRQIEQADLENHKRGRDVEIGRGRLILTSANGARFRISVADDGTVSAVAV